MQHDSIAEQLRNSPQPPKKQKGFAVLPPEEVKRITTLGGKAVHAKYGSRHMAKIGRKGGKA